MALVPTELPTVISVSARVFGALLALPLGEALATFPRLFVAICMGFALSYSLPTNLELSSLSLGFDCLIGFLIASPVRIAAEAFEMLGEWLDTARGQTIGSVMDPLNGQQKSDLSTIFRVGAVTTVIVLGGFEAVLDTVRVSYTALSLQDLRGSQELLVMLGHRGLSLLSSIGSLSAVWLLSYLLSDIAAALFARVSQGLSFCSFSTLLKTVCTLALLLNLLRDPHEALHIARSSLASPFEAPQPALPAINPLGADLP